MTFRFILAALLALDACSDPPAPATHPAPIDPARAGCLRYLRATNLEGLCWGCSCSGSRCDAVMSCATDGQRVIQLECGSDGCVSVVRPVVVAK